jgi:hypothetical protein
MSGSSTERPDGEAITEEDLRQLLADEQAKVRRLADRATAADQARVAAERQRDEARGSAADAAATRWVAEEAKLDAEMAQAEAEEESLAAQIAAAQEAGDFKALGVAQVKLARVGGVVAMVEQKKRWLADAKAMQEQQAAQARAQPQAEMRNGVDMSRFLPAEREWLEEHPQYFTDSRYQYLVASAHNAAMAEGIQRGSRAYFRAIDGFLASSEEDGRGSAGAEPRQRASAEQYGQEEDLDEAYQPARRENAAMPVTRRAPQAGGAQRDQAGRLPRLTPEQIEAADISMPLRPEADKMVNGELVKSRYRVYAENLVALRKAGRLN